MSWHISVRSQLYNVIKFKTYPLQKCVLGWAIECEGWRRHSSLSSLILQFTKPWPAISDQNTLHSYCLSTFFKSVASILHSLWGKGCLESNKTFENLCCNPAPKVIPPCMKTVAIPCSSRIEWIWIWAKNTIIWITWIYGRNQDNQSNKLFVSRAQQIHYSIVHITDRFSIGREFPLLELWLG